MNKKQQIFFCASHLPNIGKFYKKYVKREIKVIKIEKNKLYSLQANYDILKEKGLEDLYKDYFSLYGIQ